MRCQHFIVLVTILANNIYYCFESCATQLKRENAFGTTQRDKGSYGFFDRSMYVDNEMR